jgi:pyruvate-formate lyase-activating enzyme
MDKRHTLFLVSPSQRFSNYPSHSMMARMFGKRRIMIPLALPVLASLTPDHYDISIYDEEIEKLPRNARPDIVGITTRAATAKRAYQLADAWRAQGVTVIMGGPHATYEQAEALQHCDAIVAGEAEGNWERCLADFEQGTLQKVYESTGKDPYKRHKPPRWDLVNMKRVFQISVQTSRGCPFDCAFCTVTKTFGRLMRHREIDDVVAELKAAPTKYVMFVDDNLTINKTHARELMKAIMPLGLSWACMSSIEIAKDDELLSLMAEAGCFNILIGFESLNPASLTETNKLHNQSGSIYADAIKRIHSHGIHINASFVVGFDHDGLDEFQRILDFTLEHALPNVNLHLLGAAPGSDTHRELAAQGRIPAYDLDMGDGHFPLIHYMKVGQLEIFDKYMETITRLYSFDTIRAKGEALFAAGTFTRPGADISPFLKARLCAIIFKEFVVSFDADRRRLFWYLMGLIGTRKIAIDKALSYLLSMLGYHRHIRMHQRHMEEYRSLIRQYDRGPWQDVLARAGAAKQA